MVRANCERASICRSDSSLGGVELGQDVRQFTLHAREFAELPGQLALFIGQLTGEFARLALDLVQRVALLRDHAFEVDVRILEDDGFHHLDDHQEEDDGPEAAADDVQEGQSDLFEFAADHGQSADGDM